MKMTGVLFFVFCISLGQSQTKIEDAFKLEWKQFVGLTTFRSNAIFDGEHLYIPSNGARANVLNDLADGVYKLNGEGRIVHQFNAEGESDEDCNGIAIDGDRLYFGNDDGNFYCYTKTGDLMWKYNITGSDFKLADHTDDVEGVPLLADIDQDGVKDVVFTVEGRGVYALNGKTGLMIWNYLYLWEDGSYMNSPAAIDINKDGVLDIIVGAKRDAHSGPWDYQNALFAINGKSGTPLWQYDTHSGIHASPTIITYHGQPRIVVAEAYSDVSLLYTDGRLDRFVNLNLPQGGISGLFSSPVINSNGVMVIGTSWWSDEDGIWVCDINESNFSTASDGLDELGGNYKAYHTVGRVSSSAIIAELHKQTKGQEFLICTEKGEALLFDNGGNLLERFQLPAGVEATPIIADVDGDKKLELVITCLDGYVYCYQTKTKTKIAPERCSFRGRDNTGNFQQ